MHGAILTQPARTPALRLHNWNMLTVALEHFGVRLDPDMKGLIVGALRAHSLADPSPTPSL